MTRRTYTPEHKANLVPEALQSEGAKWGSYAVRCGSKEAQGAKRGDMVLSGSQ